MKIYTLGQDHYDKTEISIKNLPCIVLGGRFHLERFRIHSLLRVYGLDGSDTVKIDNGPPPFTRYWARGPQHGIVVIPMLSIEDYNPQKNLLMSWMPWPNQLDLYIRFSP